jgi:hypothetical protein
LIYERDDENNRVERKKHIPKPFCMYYRTRKIQDHGQDDPQRMDKGMPIDDGRAADRQKFNGVKNDDQG